MSVKPKLVCPPNYSILTLRFTECKKIGIVRGVNTLTSYDLSSFFIPLTNYSEKRFTLKSGKTMKLDVSDIAVYAEISEKYHFIYVDAGVADNTTHTFTIYDEAGVNVLSTLTFQVDASTPAYANFPTAFATTLLANVVMKGLIDFAGDVTELSGFVVSAIAKGTKYNYLMEYDTLNITLPGTYLHPGTLLQKSLKYPEGRVRAFMLFAEYARVDSLTCQCGCCTNASGELLSNIKNFQWAYDSEYTKKQTPNLSTGVSVNANFADPTQDNANGTQTFQWLTTGNSAAYNLEINNLVYINAVANNPYGYVSDIDGYNITVNRTGFGDGSGQELLKAWTPPSIEWKIGGEMLFISGGQDVYDTDRLYTETIWIKNTQSYDIPFMAMIIS